MYSIAILAVFGLFVFPVILIKFKFRKEETNSLWWLMRHGNRLLPFSTNNSNGMGKGLIFCPHPFTNWSLNPSYRNKLGESVHTIEGFRKTQDTGSIIQMIKENPDAYKIVCIGGSSTYCTDIHRYQDTWPALLNNRLCKENVVVINFGVAGWGTMQSVIRCVTWLTVVRPDLLIFYQAKNDFTPLYNGAKEEKSIFPDYQNIMGQFSCCLISRFSKCLLYIPLFFFLEMRKLKEGFSRVYKPEIWGHPRGFDRLTDEIFEGILFRTETIINMCNMLNCKVLYIPEIVRGGIYAEKLRELYIRIPEAIKNYKNVSLFDISSIMPISDKYFMDKMHLNKKGCRVFSEIVAEQVNKIRNPSRI